MNIVLHTYKKRNESTKNISYVNYTLENKKNQIWRLDNDLYIMDYIFNIIYIMDKLFSNNYIREFNKYKKVKKMKKGLKFILSCLIDYQLSF